MNSMTLDPVEEARGWTYIREASQNMGLRVQAIRLWMLGDPNRADSWCCYFVMWILDKCFAGASPFPRDADINGSTVAALAYARKQGWEVPIDNAVSGDLIFSINSSTGLPHHVAFLTAQDPFTVIAGNTSGDGTSSNGDRVAEHGVAKTDKVAIHYPRAA